MNEFTINVVQDPSKIININNLDQAVSLSVIQDQETLIQVQDDTNNVLLNPSVFYNGINIVYLSGVSGELLHNTFGDLQGGSTGEYYHLSSGQYFNLTTGAVIRPSDTGNFITNSQTGAFYATSNPSGFITGIDLSNYATADYVTGVSGGLQTQITTLNNATGSYVLNSQTGVFYPRTNPSGYITGVDLSFSGNYYTKTESESRYVNTTGAETILGNKTFHDNVYINNLYITGLETIVNTTNTNVASNYIMLNLTGGAVDGGIFFVTGSSLTGINDSGAIIGFDHSDEFKFGISTRASDLSTLNTIASVEQMTGISGGLQTQISILNNQTGSYVLNTQTGNFITTSQTGAFYPVTNPSGYITGVDLSAYVTGDVVRPSDTGIFYTTDNPSGFITGIADLVFTTGGQIISGIKTFSDPTVFNSTSITAPNQTISGTSSLLTKGLADSLYGNNYFSITTGLSSGIDNDQIGQKVHSLTLPSGTWEFESYAALSGTVSTGTQGTRFYMYPNNSYSFYGQILRNTLINTFQLPATSLTTLTNSNLPFSVYNIPNNLISASRLKGTLIINQETEMSIFIAQNIQRTGQPIYLLGGSYLKARKIN